MIDTATSGGVRTVTIDRPARANALTPAGLDALAAAVEAATEPVVYLHGAGAAFCAGADLDVLSGFDADEARVFAEQGQRVARVLADYDGVTVAGIDGAARGGGVELALACDIRIATPEATLAEPGVALGLFGAWGGTYRLPRLVGLGEAMDLALTGRVLDAEEARRIGLVSRVLEDPAQVACTIADHDREATAAVARLLRAETSQAAREDSEVAAFASLLAARNE